MRRLRLNVCFFTCLMVLNPVFGFSDSSDDPNLQETHGQTSTSHVDNASDHGHHFHRHHLGFFLGATYGKTHSVEHRSSEGTSQRKNFFTLGADYEFRITKFVGAGGYLDHAGGDLRSTVFGPAVFVHPFQEFKVLVSPGVDRHEGKNQFVFRTGFYYDIPVHRFTISPTFALDFLKEDTLVIYGITFGVGF